MHAEFRVRSKQIKENMVAKNKNKVLTCSTPVRQIDSPSRDSDSVCDSEAPSPVPFQCTQDGVEGERDVVWNFYTTPSKESNYHSKNSASGSRRLKKKSKIIEKVIPKRRMTKPSQKKNELLQDLIILNQNVHNFLPKVGVKTEKPQSDENILSLTSESSPRSTVHSKNRCLRKNVLSSKFMNSETDNALESDDSINECLIKVSQMVEDNILNNEFKEAKRPCLETVGKCIKPNLSVNIDQDSIDVILCNINLDSPFVHKVKHCDSPKLNNDSFDNLLGNLNDSALERLSQVQDKNDTSRKRKDNSNWTVKEFVGSSPSNKSTFGRHNSMPESPSVHETTKPSTSGMVFGRYNSMPFNKSEEKILDDSPITCTPDEIKKKHQQARERLLAKRQLPFTSSTSGQSLSSSQHVTISKKPMFTYKIPPAKVQNDVKANEIQKLKLVNREIENNIKTNTNENVDIKLLIEKKRQEALMKLRRRQPQNKSS